MGKQQVDECTKKFQQRWKNSKEAVNIMKKEVKAAKQHKLLKDQERENEVEQETWKMEGKNVWRMCTQWK